jgi:hypothetical protein
MQEQPIFSPEERNAFILGLIIASIGVSLFISFPIYIYFEYSNKQLKKEAIASNVAEYRCDKTTGITTFTFIKQTAEK